MSEQVQVACRLPNGYVIEVGFSVNVQGRRGSPFAMYRKNKDYKSVTLRGLNQRSIIRDTDGKPMAMAPAQVGRKDVVTLVPKEFWDAWVKANSENWALVNGHIYLVPKDETSAKAVAIDMKAKQGNVFEPMNPDTPMKIEDVTIRKFDKED